MMKLKKPWIWAILLLLPGTLTAQEPAAPVQPVDRVVAVVGDSAVLQSEIEEELLRLREAGQPLPSEGAQLDQFRRQLLESRISELLLLQAAIRDSITIAPEQVDEMVQRELRQREQAFGGQPAFERALQQENLTPAGYREILAREFTRTLMVRNYLDKVGRARRPPPVTEDELRAFFNAQRAQLGRRPATVTFRQVVLAPEPSDSARAAARALAEEILAKIRAGEDFEQLAKRYSDDPGSRERGGDLGWFRSGQMVPEFERAAYALRPGSISGIVESSFGFHIIKLEKIKGPERQARHVLIRPALTDADQERTRALADDVAAQLRAGAAIDSLIQKHGDDSEQNKVGPWPRDRLPPPYDTELADVQAGAILGPIRLPGEGSADKWAVVQVTEVAEAGEYTLEDVRMQAREQLQRQKLVSELVGELRERTFVEIRL